MSTRKTLVVTSRQGRPVRTTLPVSPILEESDHQYARRIIHVGKQNNSWYTVQLGSELLKTSRV